MIATTFSMIFGSSILPVASTRASSPQLGRVTIEPSVLLVLFTTSVTKPKSSIPRADVAFWWNRDRGLLALEGFEFRSSGIAERPFRSRALRGSVFKTIGSKTCGGSSGARVQALAA